MRRVLVLVVAACLAPAFFAAKSDLDNTQLESIMGEVSAASALSIGSSSSSSPQAEAPPPPAADGLLEGGFDRLASELSSLRGQAVQREKQLVTQNRQLQQDDTHARVALKAEQQQAQKATTEYQQLQQKEGQTENQLKTLQTASQKLVHQYRDLATKEQAAEQRAAAMQQHDNDLQQQNAKLIATLNRLKRAQAMMTNELSSAGDLSAAAAPPPMPMPMPIMAVAPVSEPVSFAAPMDQPQMPPQQASFPLDSPADLQVMPTEQLPPPPAPVAMPEAPKLEPVRRAAPRRAAASKARNFNKRAAAPPSEEQATEVDEQQPRRASRGLASDLEGLKGDASVGADGADSGVDDGMVADADDQVLKMARDAGFLPSQ